MDFFLMYVMPPLLGIMIGAACGVISRQRFHARVAMLVEDRIAEIRLVNERLLESNRRLAEEGLTDPLTGVPNRNFLASHLVRDTARILRLRENNGASPRGNLLLFVDIDDVAHIDARGGRVHADHVRVRIAKILGRATRGSDYVIRWNDEAFVILATDAGAKDGGIIAERILAGVRESGIRVGPDDAAPVTCSIGVSHFPFFPDHARALDGQQVLQVAELCAYVARRRGKDGWVSLCGSKYDPAFRYATLLDDLSGTPDDIFLDDAFVMTGSMPASAKRVIPLGASAVSSSTSEERATERPLSEA